VASTATLVFSNHRPETVGPATALMARHDAVILEEAPDPLFQKMLRGKVSIDAYLETLDLEYPEFGRRMSMAIRDLFGTGVRFHQADPFVAELIRIHEFFADGGRPGDIRAGTARHNVYVAEREATAALMAFYEVSVGGDFDATLRAVKRFARADADRFELRDRLRAEAIVPIVSAPGRYHIEAGLIHFPLWQILKARVPAGVDLAPVFLMKPAVREMGYRQHLYGPGDLLTLLYRFHDRPDPRREDLYAARALVYSKLIAKDEIEAGDEPYPHTRDELQTGRIAARLSLADCRRLFPLIHRAPTETARKMVRHYLKRFIHRHPGQGGMHATDSF
jgi:hypothetical protein